jgi:hypothetical protein
MQNLDMARPPAAPPTAPAPNKDSTWGLGIRYCIIFKLENQIVKRCTYDNIRGTTVRRRCTWWSYHELDPVQDACSCIFTGKGASLIVFTNITDRMNCQVLEYRN